MFELGSIQLSGIAGVAALLPALALVIGAVVARGDGVRAARRASRWAGVGLAAALAAAGIIVGFGPGGGPLVARWGGSGIFGFGVHLDALSAVMLVLVAFLGLVVVRYSVHHMAGDLGQARFVRWLSVNVAAVLVLVVAGDLLLFALAWAATSLALHRLLVFYPERPGARRAAWKKFAVSRLGDVCLAAVLVLCWRCFGSWQFSDLFAAAEAVRAGEAVGQPGCLPWIAGLLVAGALLKSAQVPFHSWLPETMDAPTPVSALMHAGIVNAGGFLVVRLSPVIVIWPPALDALVFVGGVTALMASVVMLTQPTIKRSLAWSTISQMGFMMLQCGLGAFALAVLHIVAHSLYKAHAFLAAGGVVARAAARSGVERAALPPRVLAGALLAGVLLAWGGAALAGGGHAGSGTIVLAAVFALAMVQLMGALWSAPMPGSRLAWGLAAGAAVTVVSFALHAGAGWLLAGALPEHAPPRTALEVAGLAILLLLFLAVVVLQSLVSTMRPPDWLARLYVHASNGFYLGTLAGRLVPSSHSLTSNR